MIFLVHSGHNISKKLLPSLLGFFWMCDYFPGFTLGFMSTPILSLTIDAAVSYQTATRALFQIIRNLTFWDSTLHFCSILSLALKKYLFDLERCQNSKTSAKNSNQSATFTRYLNFRAENHLFSEFWKISFDSLVKQHWVKLSLSLFVKHTIQGVGLYYHIVSTVALFHSREADLWEAANSIGLCQHATTKLALSWLVQCNITS